MRCRLVQDSLDAWDLFEEYGGLPLSQNERCGGDFDVSICRRIRLNGNYSKSQILNIAMSLRGARPVLLDFQDCWNLDEECLEAVFKWIRRPMVVILTGTLIGVDSYVIKKLNEGTNSRRSNSSNRDGSSKIHFVFGSGVKMQRRLVRNYV